MMRAAAAARIREIPSSPYGAVVLSVNVSVLLYEPLRSVSLAPTVWRNSSARFPLVTGAAHVASAVGAADPPTLPPGPAVEPPPDA